MIDPRQSSLDRLIGRLSQLIGAATSELERRAQSPENYGGIAHDADDWHDELARQLRRYTLAAYMNGARSTATLDDAAQKVVADYIKTQLDFLGAFRDEIKAASEWSNGWNSRADMYAQSIKAPWWNGRTAAWPLPAMPGDGTSQCLTRCGCSWEISELEGDGNADAYWRRAKDDSCQTCVERERQWSPLRIRNGELL